MLQIGPVMFAEPLILLALLGLPAIWWLLRATPPMPRRIFFPAAIFLRGLRNSEESPARTPWWLLVLRLALAACVIVGLAGPSLNAAQGDFRGGLLLIVVDNGWTAGPGWQQRRQTMMSLIGAAKRQNARVVILPTARAVAAEPLAPMLASDALGVARALAPRPWPVDRGAAAERLAGLRQRSADAGQAHIVWLSDGFMSPSDAAGTAALSGALARWGQIHFYTDGAGENPPVLAAPKPTPSGFAVTLLRAVPGPSEPVSLQVLGADGRILSTAPGQFAAGETELDIALSMPVALRNGADRIQLSPPRSAASLWLLDSRWQRRQVGLVSGANLELAQPLLDELFYIERAMAPFAETQRGTITALLSGSLSMLVLADIGQIVGEDAARVANWVNKGGVLLRFAGPRMAEKNDDLIPVRLRRGGRSLGGALSWENPVGMAEFPEHSPFFGLPVPAEVKIKRQILAQPEPGLSQRSWATLGDGTPLVTAERRGEGWVVLFHVTANAQWSNLPLSGLYVAMLQRLAEMSPGRIGETPADRHAQEFLPPLLVLDGFGQLGAPPPVVRPLPVGPDTVVTELGPETPPGYYGVSAARQAVNLPRGAADLQPLTGLPANYAAHDYTRSQEVSLLPPLLVLALIVLLADAVCILVVTGRGRWPDLRRRSAAASVVAVVFLIGLAGASSRADAAPAAADSASDDARILAAALETRLGYILTGDRETDARSQAGLAGLSRVLSARTAFAPAAPFGLDPETDALVFYPLIYWPMVAGQKPLSDGALAKIDRYMKNGGTILFDTRDQLTRFNSYRGNAGAVSGPGQQTLRQILGALDVPPLMPVPPEHVITKSFYLLQGFPGRYVGGQLWIEAAAAETGDNVNSERVSGLIVGSADWAAAWAIDEAGRPALPLEPGGARQRELAFRVGVNFVMYALTGNYKADQVHVPTLLERLGQ